MLGLHFLYLGRRELGVKGVTYLYIYMYIYLSLYLSIHPIFSTCLHIHIIIDNYIYAYVFSVLFG